MAGIGFRLKRLIVEDSSSGWLRAHLYGAVLSAGPWLLSICTLGTLALFSRDLIGEGAHARFQAIVVYTYTFSLITTGAAHMVVTRQLADELYVGRIGTLRRLLPLDGRMDRAGASPARRAVLRAGAGARPGAAPVRGHAAGGGVVHLDGDDLPRRGPGLRERGDRVLRGQRGEPARRSRARPLARPERTSGRLPARAGGHPLRAVRAGRARAHRGARAGDGGSHQRLRPLPGSDRGRAPLQRGHRGGPRRVLGRAHRPLHRGLVPRLALRHPDLPVLPFGRAVARHLPRQRRDRLLRSLPGVLRRGHQARHPAAGARGQAGHDSRACATACAGCWWSRAR